MLCVIGMPVGSEYMTGSDPALWPGGSGGPMPGMGGGNIGGSPYPMNPGTPYNVPAGIDMASYNQQQKTPNMGMNKYCCSVNVFL